MIDHYSKHGAKLAICPNVQIHIVTGTIPRGFLYCETKARTHALKIRVPDVKESADLYAELQSLKNSFNELTKESTLTLDALRSATYNTVDDIKLLENANLAVMLGLPTDQLPKLFESAMKLGHAVGIATDYAIMSLCKGIGRRSYLILDNIGVNMRAQQAYDWFTSEHNLEKLSDEQKRVAWQTYAMKLVEQKANTLGINFEQIERERINANAQNAKIQFGKPL